MTNVICRTNYFCLLVCPLCHRCDYEEKKMNYSNPYCILFRNCSIMHVCNTYTRLLTKKWKGRIALDCKSVKILQKPLVHFSGSIKVILAP